jgi:two-component system chemotaxis response regulator CheB
MPPKQIKVLAVCTLPTTRDLVRRALSDVGDIALLNTAPNGKIGERMAREDRPDVIVCDPQLPDMAAADFTRSVLAAGPCGIFLVSDPAPTQSAVAATMDALEAGAIDLIVKPDKADDPLALQQRLLPKIRSYSIKRWSETARALSHPPAAVTAPKTPAPAQSIPPPVTGNGGVFDIVVIGVSTGGPEALTRIIAALPAPFPLPIAIVLHMPAHFTGAMAASLAKKSRLPVKEAAEGDELLPNHVTLAPGGRHLEIVSGTRHRVLYSITDGPPENGCKPAADVLFRSVAERFGGRVLALILTGMGSDGTKGLECIKRKGGYVLAQDEASSVVWGMPGQAVEKGLADEIIPLEKIAAKLSALVNQR